METPSSDGGPTIPTSAYGAASPIRPDRIAREAFRFLQDGVIPTLQRDHHRELVTIVRKAARNEDLRPLAELAERHRRVLLLEIERSLTSHRTRATPRSIVRLTNVISGVAPPDLRFARWRTAPAR